MRSHWVEKRRTDRFHHALVHITSAATLNFCSGACAACPWPLNWSTPLWILIQQNHGRCPLLSSAVCDPYCLRCGGVVRDARPMRLCCASSHSHTVDCGRSYGRSRVSVSLPTLQYRSDTQIIHDTYTKLLTHSSYFLLTYLISKNFAQLVTEFTKLETGQCSPWRTPDHAFDQFYVLAQKMCVNVIIEINAVVELAAVLIFIRNILVSEFDWQTCYPAVFAVPTLKARSVRRTSQHVKTAAFSILSNLLRVFTNRPTIHRL